MNRGASWILQLDSLEFEGEHGVCSAHGCDRDRRYRRPEGEWPGPIRGGRDGEDEAFVGGVGD
jgi:hypothetical protein